MEEVRRDPKVEHRARQVAAVPEPVFSEYVETAPKPSRSEQHATVTGLLLIERKRRLAHGEWLPWLADNFDGSRQTADNYRNMAESWLAANCQSAGNLDPVPAPSTDAELVALPTASVEPVVSGVLSGEVCVVVETPTPFNSRIGLDPCTPSTPRVPPAGGITGVLHTSTAPVA